MDEKIFFEQGNIKVTNARFIVGAETHAMNGVTSVKSHAISPNRTGPIIGIVIGLLILLSAESSGKVFGLLIAGVAGWIFYKQKATHSVVLRSASGEVQAHTSQNEPLIGGIVQALNDALIHRG